MDETWIRTLITLLGGGAMGALIKIAYDLRREKIQTVSRGIRVFPLFRRDKDHKDFDAVLSVVHDGRSAEFRNLFVADVMLHNRGSHDYSEFEFGISISASSKCVHVGWENPDQHHILSLLDIVSPSEPRSEIKFSLKPFNRRDDYSLRLYLAPELQEEPAVKNFTTPHAVRFVDDPSFSDRTSDGKYITRAFGTVTIILLLVTILLLFMTYRLVNFTNDFSKAVETYRQEIEDQKQTLRLVKECYDHKGTFDWQKLVCVSR